MIMTRNEDGTYSQVGFVKDNAGIDTEYIYDKDGDIVFEKGFTRETSGTVPLTINGIGKDLKDWSITGNTVQNGTPTPENPVDVQSTGDYDEETGMYKIPVVTRGKNLFDYNLMFQNSVVYSKHFNVYNLILKPFTEYEISTNVELIQSGTQIETLFIVCNTAEDLRTINGGVSYNKTLHKTTGADGVLRVAYRTFHDLDETYIVKKADMDAGILWLNIIQTPITTPIYLPTPLYSGEVMRSDGSREVKLKGTKIKNIQWTYSSEYSRFVSNLIKNNIPSSLPRSIIGYCDIYECLHNGEEFDISWSNKFYIVSNGTSTQIYIHDTRFNNVNDFVSSVGEYKIYFPVELTTKTFTAPQIPTLNGTTVIDVDTAVKPTEMYTKYKSSK